MALSSLRHGCIGLKDMPASSLSMLENSWHRKRSRVEQLVLAARRLTSSKSTAAGWCLVTCSSNPYCRAEPTGRR